MFDLGFSELVVIGAVALVVLGPEKLPIVARKTGEWLGKAQRMVAQVKSDIEREAELSELKRIQDEAKSVADDLTKTVQGQTSAIENEVKSLQSDVKGLEKEVNAEAKKTEDGFNALTQKSEENAVESVAEPKYKELSDTEPNPAFSDLGQDSSSSTADDFYNWYGEDPNSNSQSHVFDKRYKPGPSIDDLAEQLERLKAELGDRSPQLGTGNRRYASRARSNRVRIYR